MSSITIYMEGGGDSIDTRAALRQGMDSFLQPLKHATRNRGWSWNLVCRGPRGEAFRAFCDAVSSAHDILVVLLVDAERPVGQPARHHLKERDGWDLSAVGEDRVHLMVQAMEAWFVADPTSISEYYGHGFRKEALSSEQDLEGVTTYNLSHWLRRAMRDSSKGNYHKTRHASDLLKLIDRATVAARCRHCKRLFDVLGDMIAASEEPANTKRG